MLRAFLKNLTPGRRPEARSTRLRLTLLLGAVALLAAGCSFTTKQSTFDPHGPVARDQLHLFYVTVGVSVFIFLIVGGFAAVAVWRFREKPGDEGKPMPYQSHGNPVIEIGLIAASIALLVIVAVPTMKSIWLINELPTDQPYYAPSLLGRWFPDPPQKSADEVLNVTVYGYQWWWGFEYKQFGVVTSNELVLPAGKVVKFDLRSRDVIHSFWLPKLGGKVDVIPGRANWLWLMADDTATGLFYGQCAEYCGEAHAYMLFRARVLTPDQFVAWVAEQKRPIFPPGNDQTWATDAAAVLAKSSKFPPADMDKSKTEWIAFINYAKTNPDKLSDVQKGAALFMGRATCVQCHTITGSPAAGTIGPNLSHVAARSSLAAGILDNLSLDGKEIDLKRQLQNFARWISHSQDVKPGNKMYYLATGLSGVKLQGITLKRLAAVNKGLADVEKLGLSTEQKAKLDVAMKDGGDPDLSAILTRDQLTALTDGLTDEQFTKIGNWPTPAEFADIAQFLQTLK